MSTNDSSADEFERIDEEAATWILRRDRGLTPEEVRELALRLESDPVFRSCVERYDTAWADLDLAGQLKPSEVITADPDLLAPKGQRSRWIRPMLAASSVAAAIALGIGLWIGHHSGTQPQPLRDLALPDGSRVELNSGADIAVEFTTSERRVRLIHGEAQFFVAKNAQRPFLVQAGRTEVKAVGTAFDVALADKAVNVIVTEGQIKLDPDIQKHPVPNLSQGSAAGSFVAAGQRAVIPLDRPNSTPLITDVSLEEMDRMLSWQPRIMDYTDVPLSTIVIDFNRRNVTQLFIVDPRLYGLRISATLRSDNVDGFVRLLEASFGVSAEHRSHTEIALSRAP
jgi:transmembrane sensor